MRITVLLGPSRSDWRESVSRAMAGQWDVTHSFRRTSFARDVQLAKPHFVVLNERDGDGLPNEPLLSQPALSQSPVIVLLVHEEKTFRVHSVWTAANITIHHVTLELTSSAAVGSAVVELLNSLK